MSLRVGLIRAGRSTRVSTTLVPRYQRPQSQQQYRQLWSFFKRAAVPNGHETGSSSHPSPSASTQPIGNDDAALIHRFNNCVWTNDAAGIFRHYELLRETATKRSQAEPLLARQELIDALAMLAATSGPSHSQNMALIEKMMCDMPALFRTPVTEDVHRAILGALLKPRGGALEAPYKWLLTMQHKPGHVAPSLTLWHLFLRHCAEHNSLNMLRRAVREMRAATGCKPTPTTYHILINAMHDAPSPPPVKDMIDLINEMYTAGLSYDPITLGTMCEGYTANNKLKEAHEIEAAYEAKFVGENGAREDEDPALEELAETAARDGIHTALKKFRSRDELNPSIDIIGAILRGSYKATELRLVEREVGIRIHANERIWGNLIRNAVVHGYPRNATELYELALKAGVRPNAHMADSVIHALCFSSQSVRGPSDRALDEALAIYRELCSAAATPDDPAAATAATPTASIYHNLLRALASSGNTAKYLPEVTSLVEDMSARGLEMNGTVLALTIVASMRAARTHGEAFHAYEQLTQGAAPLDAMSFHRILDAYCKLSPRRGTLPSPRDYFAIVRDMRSAGHALTPAVYTIFLRHLGARAVQVRAAGDTDARDALLATLRRTHDRLALDAGLTPDAHLWNTLMDAYQRAGASGDALRVWDTIVRQGRVDEAGVSIILDACSHAGDYSLLRDTWAQLLERRFPLNQRNWNNFVEGLCRLGRIKEATKVICVDMKAAAEDNGGVVRPNEDVVRIVLKFAQSYDATEEVQERVRTLLPEVWETLPENLRT